MSRKVLFIGLVWPEPTSSAAGTRIVQLVNLFLAQGDEVHFASAAAKSEYSFEFDERVSSHPIKLNNESFNHFIQNLTPQIVIFDRFVIEEQFGWRVLQECPNALRVLDTEDLHFLRKGRQGKTENRYNDITKREIAAILRCDLSLIISEVEMDLLQNDFKLDASILYYLPFLEEEITEETTASWIPFNERKDFVFIGNYLHEPNWQTLLYLKKEIWPLLSKRLPDVALQVYGAYAAEKVIQLQNPKQRFLVKGRAENARTSVAQHRVLLAPLTFGAGVKGKLIDAIQTGTPSVSSTVGAEAMQGDLPWAGIVTDNVDEFVNAAIQLYNDENAWAAAQKNGIEIINQRYAKTEFESNFISKLNKLIKTLDLHRQQNFIGQILNHHSMQSTKYMSLWIEGKNSSPNR